MGERKEARTKPRHPLGAPVSVSWQDGRGAFRSMQGRGIDICETGLQIEIPESVDRGSIVTIRAERLSLSAATTVRYCRRQGPNYRLGLEFIGGLRWRPPVRQGGEPAAPFDLSRTQS
jgi:PilZ domain-containing protein